MDTKKVAIVAVGALALAGIGYGIYRAVKKTNVNTAILQDDCANQIGYHWDSVQKACVPDSIIIPPSDNLPMEIYFMTGEQGGSVLGGQSPWGTICGWQSTSKNGFPLGTVTEWEVDGVPLGVGVKPYIPRDGFSTLKATISDGVRTGSMVITPADNLDLYGTMWSNVVGGNYPVYGTGKLSGKRIYNGYSLTPEYVFVSFKKGKFPYYTFTEPSYEIDGLYGFLTYGYGSGGLDYNIWNWTVGTLLEAYWRPMNSGETFYAYTKAAWLALGGSWNAPGAGTLWCFIDWAAYSMAMTFQYGASILWDKAGIGNGTFNSPWVADDGWQGEGYYVLLLGTNGYAMHVSDADKTKYFNV